MCEPITIGLISAASGIMGAAGAHQDAQAQADYQNQASSRDYKYQLARREGEWNQALSIWGNKKADYQNEYDSNYAAAGRSEAAEQYRLNEMFQQAAFQKQDMLSQLIQGQGSNAASGKTGNTAARLDQTMLAAFGRNNAIIAENLASARSAMIQRNEDNRLQLQSANNKAWSQVALAPTPGIAPPQPVMVGGPSGIGLVSGILGGISSGIGAYMGAKAPKDRDNPYGGQQGGWGGQSFNGTKLAPDTPQLVPTPKIPNPPSFPKANNWGGNGFNYNSRFYNQ